MRRLQHKMNILYWFLQLAQHLALPAVQLAALALPSPSPAVSCPLPPPPQGWCRPGVVSYRRFDGPIILPYTAASVMNRWAQVYDAMSTDVR